MFSLVATMVAKADASSYLYWMVDTENTPDYSTLGYDKAQLSYKYINESGETVYGGSLMSYVYNDESSTSPFQAITPTKGDVDDSYEFGTGFYANLAPIADKTSVSFYIELFNDGQRVMFSDGYTYDSIATQYIASFDPANPTSFIPLSTPWSAPAPEPTSGLLMLLGMAALGLKRRKMTNA